jgi:hypothetical protein
MPEPLDKSTNMLTWLHISDLQFRASPVRDDQVLQEALLQDIHERVQKDNLRPDFVAVSGDIAFSGKPQEYAVAREFFDRLLQATGLPRPRLFVVPGNHDVDRSLVTEETLALASELNDSERVNSDQGLRAFRACFQEFSAFIQDYLPKPPTFFGVNSFVQQEDMAGWRVAVLCLNSAWLALGSEQDGERLAVGEFQTRQALELAQGADVRIALLHHPFTRLQAADRKNSEARLTHGCDVILHGHLYRPDLVRPRIYSSGAVLIAAGACHATRAMPNMYNWVRLDGTGAGVYFQRRYSDQTQHWIADDSDPNRPGGITNFEWRGKQPESTSVSQRGRSSARQPPPTEQPIEQSAVGTASASVWPLGKCLAGVVTANPPLSTQDLEAIAISQVEAIKVLTMLDPDNNKRVIQSLGNIRPDLFIVARLSFPVDAIRKVRFDPQSFFSFVNPALEALYASDVRYFEVHNEPNLEVEGLGWNWTNGGEFGDWLLQVLDLLHKQFPDARFGFPGLSPQPNIFEFLNNAKSAIDKCDWIGVHCYWQNNGDGDRGMLSGTGGMYWKQFRTRFPDRLLMITEFSNNSAEVDPAEKGRQYARYLQLLRHEPNLGTAFAFVLNWYGQDANREGWVSEEQITAIPRELGRLIGEPGYLDPLPETEPEEPQPPKLEPPPTQTEPTSAPESTTPPPELISPYGEPNGPRQRFDEVMAGLSIQTADGIARTITAVVKGGDGQPKLLLPGDVFPQGAEIAQPSPALGEDKIGVVEKQDKDMGVASVSRVDGERHFLSKLPNGQPVAGIEDGELRGRSVCKFGGQTGYTEGKIEQAGTSISRGALTDRPLVTSNDAIVIAEPDFSLADDIGALVVTVGDNKAVGVIVGHTKEQWTVCLPVQPILTQFGVSFVSEPVRYIPQQPTTDQLAASRDLPGGEDRLGFTQYREAFVRLIKDTEPPLTIGIYGAWGTGKSFLMDMIAKQLRAPGNPTLWYRFFSWFIPALCNFLGDPALWQEISAQVAKQAETDVKKIQKRSFWQWLLSPPNTEVLTVWYDAWDYNSSDKLWAGLVERIFRCIEYSGLGWYGQIRINLRRNVECEWDRLRPKLLPYTLILIVFLALIAGFVLTNQATWAALIGGSTALALVFSLARQMVALFSTPASRRIVDLFAAPDYTSDLGFMGRIKLDLEGFANSLPPKMKVVIFIDDLDRCDAKKAVEVLEAIKLLLDMERFIVFLALDARIITQEVEEHYGKVLVDAEITGYEYLDKIVQIPFSIPDAPPDELYGYLGSLMGITNRTDLPPIETLAARRAQAIQRQLPTQFVAQSDMAQPPHAPEPAAPTPASGVPGEQPLPTPVPPVGGAQREQPPQPIVEEPQVEEREEVVNLGLVTFDRKEREAFLSFYADLDPNPRRIKRLVNIYQLVRALIANRPKPQGVSMPNLLDPPHHVMGWLVLCEQWPYAAHMLLEEFDRQSPKLLDRLSDVPIAALYEAAKRRIALEDNKALKKLDLKHDLLESFITVHLDKFTLEDMRRLRPFTVNFNPALSAEVRLTLSCEKS